MKFPIVINHNNMLIVANANFFDRIGNLDLSHRVLEMNISSAGAEKMKWILDCEGKFYPLRFREVLPLTFFQRVGLDRKKERYSIEPERMISAGELLECVSSMTEKFEEAPFVAELRAMLSSLAHDHLLTGNDMRRYLEGTDSR